MFFIHVLCCVKKYKISPSLSTRFLILLTGPPSLYPGRYLPIIIKTFFTLIAFLLLKAVSLEWSATSEEEAEDIRREAGKDAVCHLAEDLPRKPEEIKHITGTVPTALHLLFCPRCLITDERHTSPCQRLKNNIPIILRYSIAFVKAYRAEEAEGQYRKIFEWAT